MSRTTKDLLDILSEDRLALNQQLSQLLNFLAVCRDQRASLVGSLVDQSAHLLVDLACGLLAERLGEGVALTRRVVVADVADLFAHTIVGHHRVCHIARALQIVQCARADCAEEGLLCHTSCNHTAHTLTQVATSDVGALLGQIPRRTEALAARNDRNLHHGIALGQQPHHGSVSRLVNRRSVTLLSGHYGIFLLQTTHDTVDSGQEILFCNLLLVVSCSDQSGLVADIGDVGTRETCRLLCQELVADTLLTTQLARMNAEDRLALLHVGQTHVNLTVETTRTHQRLVQNICAVGCCQHDHTRVGRKAVHLGQHLVQCIFALVVARETCILATCTTDSVDLVDEDDAGSLLLGLLEQVAHTRCTHTHKHLDEVRAADRQERNVSLAGNGLSQHRLTCSRRTNQQCALGNLTAQLAVFLRVAQKIDDLHNLLLGLLHTRHVLERHAVFVVLLVVDLSASLAHVHHVAATAATCRTHHKDPETDDQNPRQQIAHDVQPAILALLVFDDGLLLRALLGCGQILAEGIDRADRKVELHLPALGDILIFGLLAILLDRLLGQFDLGLLFVHDVDLCDLAIGYHLLDDAPIRLDGLAAVAREHSPANDEDQQTTPEHTHHRCGTLVELAVVFSILFCHNSVLIHV